MKVLYIVTKSIVGGTSTYLYQLSKELKEKGVEVAIMAQPGGWLDNKAKELGIKFYPNKYFKNSINLLLGFAIKKQLLVAITDFKPDIIHCNSSVAGFWTRVVVKNSIPTIFTAHGWAFTGGVPKWRKILAILVERYVSKYCSKIICVSENDRKLALTYKIVSEDKLVTIHNGIELDPWDSICKLKEDKKKELDLTEYSKQMRIVFVGRLATPKDPITLIKAFKELPDSLQKESHIFIVGDGPDRGNIKTMITKLELENKVHLLGILSRDKVKMINLSADIFVLTTNWEGFPYTIIEAMSCGLPVITSDVGGCSEAVDSNCGFLVKRGDIDGVKNALAKLIISKELREQMGKAGYEKARESFALPTMLQATEAVYKEVLGQK